MESFLLLYTGTDVEPTVAGGEGSPLTTVVHEHNASNVVYRCEGAPSAAASGEGGPSATSSQPTNNKRGRQD